ncbi:hypothetical protein BDV33DRAFT_203627 [Aspergillus novoparasiticus]|uniref:Uncharacterized protein n=1 Tax=Aspergillus novoparasiticus TaxID=986946 RepID=A0A5N6EUG9_9EURO|nr:hypothetical protein BDV33DRAFT_203627 [Aspergillus novoparasiticus]
MPFAKDYRSEIDLNPLRVYRPLSESRAFRNHGKSITDHEADTASQDGDKPLSGGEDGGEDKTASATVPEENTKAPVVKPPSSNTAVIQDNNAEATPCTVIPLHNQIPIDKYLKLQAKVIEMAPYNNKPLMARRPSDEQVLDQVTNFLLLLETVEFQGAQLKSMVLAAVKRNKALFGFVWSHSQRHAGGLFSAATFIELDQDLCHFLAKVSLRNRYMDGQ